MYAQDRCTVTDVYFGPEEFIKLIIMATGTFGKWTKCDWPDLKHVWIHVPCPSLSWHPLLSWIPSSWAGTIWLWLFPIAP